MVGFSAHSARTSAVFSGVWMFIKSCQATARQSLFRVIGVGWCSNSEASKTSRIEYRANGSPPEFPFLKTLHRPAARRLGGGFSFRLLFLHPLRRHRKFLCPDVVLIRPAFDHAAPGLAALAREFNVPLFGG